MRTREKIIAEMVQVAEALERPNLTPEQRARGEAKYAALEAELDALEQAQRTEQQAERTAPTVDPNQKYIDKIWSTLDPEGKRRRRYG